MDLNKNREKAVAERKAGANKVLDRVRGETGDLGRIRASLGRFPAPPVSPSLSITRLKPS